MIKTSFLLLPAAAGILDTRHFLHRSQPNVTHVIVVDSQDSEPLYFLIGFEVLLRHLDGADDADRLLTLGEIFDLASSHPTPVFQTGSDYSTEVSYVVLEDQKVVGFVSLDEDEGRSTKQDLRGTPKHPSPERFEAYPHLSAPVHTKPCDRIEILVGFRPDNDPTLQHSGKVLIENPGADEQCELRYVTKGLTPERTQDRLPLDPNVLRRVSCTVDSDAPFAEFKVQYFARGQLVGAAVRQIVVLQDGDIPPMPTEPANPCRITLSASDRPVDLTVSVTYGLDGRLSWIFCSADYLSSEPEITAIGDAKAFAAKLLHDLDQVKNHGTFAKQVLETKGSQISDAMPKKFFELLDQAARRAGGERRKPTLLLLTDEVYVPWELAHIHDPIDPNAPSFLGCQTIMGRWCENESILLPPSESCEIRKLRIFAAKYPRASDRLDHALLEQESLAASWTCSEVMDANAASIEHVLKEPKMPGQAAHFATHGLSDPDAGRQELILEDCRIPAAVLGGAHRCGAEPPRFSFLFLNACQVGTPGKELAEIAGFPGIVVRGGALGVVAPLWQVGDADARRCAETFYRNVFLFGMSVGEALQECRAAYDGGSTTPLAYIFYGHPRLRLEGITLRQS